MTTKIKMPNHWMLALKQFNHGKNTWCVAKKGTPEHAHVMEIMNKMKNAKQEVVKEEVKVKDRDSQVKKGNKIPIKKDVKSEDKKVNIHEDEVVSDDIKFRTGVFFFYEKNEGLIGDEVHRTVFFIFKRTAKTIEIQEHQITIWKNHKIIREFKTKSDRKKVKIHMGLEVKPGELIHLGSKVIHANDLEKDNKFIDQWDSTLSNNKKKGDTYADISSYWNSLSKKQKDNLTPKKTKR